MELTKEEAQQYFDTDFDTILLTDEDDCEYIKQCHAGDLLIEKYDHDSERFNLWKQLDENGGGIMIEYAGRLNRHSWETVGEFN